MAEAPQLPPSVKKPARIEIIPLIDVIFFLLATFVLFTLSLNKIQSMEGKLPVTDPPKDQIEPPEPPMVIQASEGQVVYIDQVARSITDVAIAVTEYMERQARERKLARVLITGDDSAKFGNFIKILDAVKSTGIRDISLETNYRRTGG